MNTTQDLVQITKDYYDSQDADEFYHFIWGGEDIHIGLYICPAITIKEASRNTVEAMADRLPNISSDTKVLDIGSGYGGSARFLASKFGCPVDCLNLSATENRRNKEKTATEGLDSLVSITTGNFEQLPFEDNSYDVVWSQDAILHSSKKDVVLQEVSRVLKPGGYFIFTDPMQSDDCPAGVLQPVLDRIHLEEMGSVKKYRRLATANGMEEVFVDEMPHQLINHYSRVKEELTDRYEDAIKKSSQAYVDRMLKGLTHWVEAGKKGYLNWGILLFQKQ